MVRSRSSFQQRSRSAFSSGSSASANCRSSGSSPSAHLLGLGDLRVELLEAAVLGGQLGQRAVLAGHGRTAGAESASTSGSTSCRSSSSKRRSFSSSRSHHASDEAQPCTGNCPSSRGECHENGTVPDQPTMLGMVPVVPAGKGTGEFFGRKGRKRSSRPARTRLRASVIPRPRPALCGLLLDRGQAAVPGAGELLLELLDPTGRIHVLQLASIERMASVQYRPSSPGRCCG